MNRNWYWNYGDASDVSPVDSTLEALHNLADDCSWVVGKAHDIVVGWMHDMDHNGRAFVDGFYAVCSDTQVEWIDNMTVSFNTWSLTSLTPRKWEHPECIMNYWYAWQGTAIWCSSCRATVNENIWGD